MEPDLNIQDHFYEHFYFLKEDVILQMNNNDYSGGLNNVIVRLENHCYGVFLDKEDNESGIEYSLFYVNGTDQLEGGLLKLNVKLPFRDELIFFFANYISVNYEQTDLVNTFNTFQRHTRTMLEKLNYLTVASTEIDAFPDQNATIIAKGVKGIIQLRLLRKAEFYKVFFDTKSIEFDNNDSSYLYLMLNKRTDLIKIGKSKRPRFREKTLQSDEPDIEMISCWKAPSSFEMQLHKIFAIKRQRGEWFDLNFKDLKQIKDLMKEFE